MKKLIPVAMLAVFMTVSCNQKVEKSEENLEVFISTCEQEAKKQTAGMFTDEDVTTYCTCAADKAMDEFSTAEMLKMNLPNADPELEQRMMKVVQPCIDDLSTKAKQ